MGIVNAISQAVQLQLTAGEHILSGAPTASSTKSLLRLGSSLVVGSANGTYIGIGAPAGLAGDIFRAEVDGLTVACIRGDGAGSARMGIGITPSAGRLTLAASGNNETDAVLRITNATEGTAVGVGLFLVAGTSNSAFIFNYPAAYTGVPAWADKLVIGGNTSGAAQSSGCVMAFRGTGAAIDFEVGSASSRMKIADDGGVRIGGSLTSSLARLQVVGQSDQVQLLVRNNGTQTASPVLVQNSAGTVDMFEIVQTGNINSRDSSGNLRFNVQNANQRHAFNTTAVGNQALTILSGGTGNKVCVARGIASQTGNLFEAQRVDSVGGGGQGMWHIDSNGNMAFLRTSSTTSGRQTAVVESGFVVSTDASRTGYLELQATDFNGTRTALRVEADGTAARIGFLGATAIVRPSATTDLRVALINLGLYTTGGASPLDLNGGNFQTTGTGVFGTTVSAGRLRVATGATGTRGILIDGTSGQTADLIHCTDNTSNNCPIFEVLAAGDVAWQRRTTTSPNNRLAAQVTVDFAVTADATREGRITVVAADFNGNRTILEGRANGTNPMIGFLGTAAVVQQTGASAAGIAAILDANAQAAISALQTALANFGLVTSPA